MTLRVDIAAGGRSAPAPELQRRETANEAPRATPPQPATPVALLETPPSRREPNVDAGAAVGPRPPPPSSTAAAPVVPLDPVTDPQRLSAAFDFAYGRVANYIGARHMKLTEPMILGPTMDGTYFYRLGNRGTNGYGMRPGQLEAARTELVAKGFPELEQSELDATNVTSFYGRSRGTPILCVKHFPGGDATLELTETSALHYGSADRVAHWIDTFDTVFHSARPPGAVMLSHASYTREGFPGIAPFDDQRRASSIVARDVPFDELPASLNPAMVAYLREHMGFKGLIVPDWYDMDAIDAFAERLHIEHDPLQVLDGGGPLDADERSKFEKSVRNFILGVEAGVNFIPTVQPWVADQPLWQTYIAAHPDFGRRLDAVVADTYARIRRAGDPDVDLGALTTQQKILLLIHNPKQHDNDDYFTPFVSSSDANVRNAFAMFMKRGLGDYDVWNRSGVTTLLARQFVVEHLTGRSFATPPTSIGEEEPWFDALMKNPAFREVYDRIDWASPEIRAIRATAVERTTGMRIAD